jgi:hypothetical protein
VPVSYVFYSILYLVISYSPTWLVAAPRYVLGLFPLFIMMALLVEKRRIAEALLDFTLVMFLGLFTTQYFRGDIY